MTIIHSLKCTKPFSFVVALLSLALTLCHLLLLIVTRCITRCHSLSLVVLLVVICCHSFYHSLSFVVTRCTTRLCLETIETSGSNTVLSNFISDNPINAELVSLVIYLSSSILDGSLFIFRWTKWSPPFLKTDQVSKTWVESGSFISPDNRKILYDLYNSFPLQLVDWNSLPV